MFSLSGIMHVCILCYCDMVRWAWWDWELSRWPTNHTPSVFCCCWLCHRSCKNIVPEWPILSSGTL